MLAIYATGKLAIRFGELADPKARGGRSSGETRSRRRFGRDYAERPALSGVLSDTYLLACNMPHSRAPSPWQYQAIQPNRNKHVVKLIDVVDHHMELNNHRATDGMLALNPPPPQNAK